MATGTPSSKRSPDSGLWGIRISYEGMVPAPQVLAGSRGRLEELFRFGGDESPNRLVLSDNLRALRTLLDEPTVAGHVRLVYIDPPYATGYQFESPHVGKAYEDSLGGSEYLEAIRQRLLVLRELLAPDGSIYVHLDRNMICPVKLIVDEIFGEKQFRNIITRVKCNPKNFTSRQFGDECDYLLFYSRTSSYVWNRPVIPWEGPGAEREYCYVEESTGRRYKRVPCHAPGVRNGETGQPWRGRLPPPGKHWVHPPATLDALDKQGAIYWSGTGNPRRKIYLDESPGRRVANFWSQFRDTQNQMARITGFPTEKNLAMMDLIVQASSNPGDLVLDAYAGSGTTLEAAGLCDRRWIGIDSSVIAVKTALDRLRLGTVRMGSYARSTYLRRVSNETASVLHHGRVLVDSGDAALATDGAALLEEDFLEEPAS